MIRTVVLVALLDLRLLFRAKEAWIWTFVMPPVFMFFMSGVLPDALGDSQASTPLTLVAAPEAGFLVNVLEERLDARGFAVTRSSTSRPTEDGDISLVVPQGFTSMLLRNSPVDLRLRVSRHDTAAEYARLQCRRAVFSIVADILRVGSNLTPENYSRVTKLEPRLSLHVVTAGRGRSLRSVEHIMPGTMVMFTMLILLTSGAVSFVVERESGTLRRQLVVPAGPTAIVAGKVIGRMFVGLIQLTFGLVTGIVLLELPIDGSVAALAAIMTIWAGFCAVAGLLVGTYAASENQAVAFGTLGTVVLSALGGCWWPVELAPPWLASVANGLPSGWAMTGFQAVLIRGVGIATLPSTVILLVAVSLIGAIVVRRRLGGGHPTTAFPPKPELRRGLR